MSDAKYKQIPAAVGTDGTADVDKTAAPPAKTSPRRSRSFFWRLCKFLLLLALSCAVVCAVLVGAVFYGGRQLANAVGEAVVPQITSDAPLDLPPAVRLSAPETTDLFDRIHEFKHALHRGESPPRDLVLTEREINGLICDEGGHGRHHGHHHHHHNHKGEMCGKVHVTVSDGQLTADFSVPLDDHVPGGEGRYMVGSKITHVEPVAASASSSEPSSVSSVTYFVRNAVLAGDKDEAPFPIMDTTGTVEVSSDGAVDVRAKSAEVLGWRATDAFVERFFEGRNLAGLFQCPHAKKHANALGLIKGVDIGDGKVVVRVRGGRDGEEHKEEEEEEEEVEAEYGMRSLLRAGQ